MRLPPLAPTGDPLCPVLLIYVGALLVVGLPLWDTGWAVLQPSGELGWAQPWRLLLGHWVHAGWAHLLLNAVALAAWFALFPESSGSRLAALVCLSLAVGSGVSLWVDAAYVVGLSGLLHGLFCASAVAGLGRAETRLVSAAVIALLAGKVAYEQALGAVPATEALVGLPVATRAHLIGVIAGAVYGGARAAIVGGAGHQTLPR